VCVCVCVCEVCVRLLCVWVRLWVASGVIIVRRSLVLICSFAGGHSFVRSFVRSCVVFVWYSITRELVIE
jgi:hypothetical protein